MAGRGSEPLAGDTSTERFVCQLATLEVARPGHGSPAGVALGLAHFATRTGRAPSLVPAVVFALIRKLVTGLAGVVGRRHVVVLPHVAGGDARLFALRAPYRVNGRSVAFEVTDRRGGELRLSVRGYAGHFPGEPVWQPWPFAHAGPCTYSLDLAAGMLWRGATQVAQAGKPIVFPTRRFAIDVALGTESGGSARRQTGHYLTGGERPVDAAYFGGDNYVDHEAESAGEHASVVALLREHGAGRRVLEVGCATGGLVGAMCAAGFDAVGADFSAWAVGEATKRLGERRAWQCDAERDAPPSALVKRGPYDALVLWVTLEHFRAPWTVLAALATLCAPGAKLFIKTTSAGSLTHQLFGNDWEGHFDWTHHGVEAVSVRTLRAQLPALGWRLRWCETSLVWDGSADPLHATVREWYSNDARFRALIAEKELGDLVTVVAERA